jgi:hypothetical protein
MKGWGWVKGLGGLLMAFVFALGRPGAVAGAVVSGLGGCGHGAGRSALVGHGLDWRGVGDLRL